ncbi:autotransporter-associated N-terminal domain-containing protein [Fusobacterium animalis]|uniref:autotransporter-associated N-terminal domain-containing protein n=1 Tax=Fusobacterium animalis TaxID=76859 RepID=UPI0030D39465
MGNNNLYKIENTLRSIAKRYKSVKYSLGLAILFLMMGVGAFSAEVNDPQVNGVPTREEIATSKENLRNSVGSLQSKIDSAKKENEKGLTGLKLELIQLMEQGDQVVKSPWASWQFGANYMYSKWNGTYKGRGDKSEKYPFEGEFVRSTNAFGRSTTARTAAQKQALNSIIAENGGFSPDNAGLQYGLIGRAQINEDPISIEVSAGIRPKNIQKGAITLSVPPVNITQPRPSLTLINPSAPNAPNINIPSFSPVAPDVKEPQLPPPPVYNLVLGADCNEGCNSNSSTRRQTTQASWLNSSEKKDSQNIQVFLHYTWSNNKAAETALAFKMYKETNTTDIPVGEYNFNSYNYGNGKEFANNIVNSQGDERNHQDFFIGGSRFWELDNYKGKNGRFELKPGTTLNLGGIFTLGIVSQENGAHLVNMGMITDAKEKDDLFIRNFTDKVIKGPSGNLDIKKSQDGYVGYKVGLAQVEENSNTGVWGTADQTLNQYQQLINEGTIDFRGNNSMGIYVYQPRNIYSSYIWDSTKAKVINAITGKIYLSGKESYGMRIAAKADGNAEMTNKGLIELRNSPLSGGKDKADKSVAMIMKADDTVKYKVSIAENKINNEGTIKISGTVENSIGMYLDIASNMTNKKEIEISSKASDGNLNVGMRADQVQDKYTDSNYDTSVINAGTGKISLIGENAIGMIAANTSKWGSAKAKNLGEISITAGKRNIGMLSANEASVINETTGKINIGTSPNSVGMASMIQGSKVSKAENKGEINVTGANSTGVYNTGEFLMNTATAKINVAGRQSIGLYAKGNATQTKTELKSGTVTASNSGVGLYADKSTVRLGGGTDPLNLIANNGGLLFYNYESNNKNNVANGVFNLAGNVKATVNNGGYAFYLKGTTINPDGTMTNLANFFNSMFDDKNSTGKLDVNLRPGGTLMVLDRPTGGNIRLSNVANTSSIASSLGNRVNINSASTKYKVYAVYRGGLQIDQNVQLDNDSNSTNPDAFYKVDFRSSNMTLDSGKTMTGSKQGQVALFQGNYDEGTEKGNVGDITITNNGTIKLSGNSTANETTTAMAGDFITLANKGNVEVSGNNGVGIFGASGSKILNDTNGTISIGQQGVALYGANELLGSTLGDKTISLTNKGTIKAVSGKTKVFGMFAKNDLTKNADLAKSTLTNSGTIDFTSSAESIGIHSINSTILNTGKINMGLKGVAINAENSNITSSGDITLAGNGIAFNLGGSFAGRTLNFSSKVTLNGNGNSIFNLKDMAFSSSGANLTENLNIVSNGKSFSYFSMDNSVLTYDKNKTFTGNKVTLVSAKNSTVDWRANIKLNGQENVAFYLNGRKAGSVPELKTAVGKTIILSDKSVGAYGVNGARIQNNSNITVGAYGAALYSTGINGTLRNTGILTLGKNSAGIYMKDGTSVTNLGQINSTQEGAKGLVVSRATAATYTNNGKIKLTGTGSIGIHAEGAAHNIISGADVEVGNTTGNDQSVAIHLKNGGQVRVLSHTSVKAGNNSIGIYGTTSSATVENNAKVQVGDGAIGIYAKGGNVNLDSGSKMTIGKSLGTNKEAVGVYYVGNGGTVNNNLSSFTIGKGSIGIVDAGTGASIINNNLTSVNLPGDAVYTYTSNTRSNVNGNTTITSSGNGNYGYYVAGNLTNNGAMDLSSGNGNVGIYSAYKSGNGIARNYANIKVGKTDLENELYSIGMAAGYTNKDKPSQNRIGHVVNMAGSTISVGNENSIGMYASGAGSTAENNGTIRITAKKGIGMYLENGATGINGASGLIEIDAAAQNAIAVYSTGASTVFKNYGTIRIKAPTSKGIVTANGANNNVIAGNIIAQNGAEKTKNIEGTAGGDKKFGDKTLSVPRGGLTNSKIKDANGNIITPTVIDTTNTGKVQVTNDPVVKKTYDRNTSKDHQDFGSISRIGMYVDTSGVNFTNPIQGLEHLRGLKKADLIIGAEAAEYTNAKTITVGKNILKRYNRAIANSGLEKWDILSGSLTWAAVPLRLNGTGEVQGVVMTKTDYKEYAKNSTVPYNFLDGLEQRYDKNSLDSNEKRVFNKINSIGKNEPILLSQAFDEMLGQQYANVQQRVQATGDILDKEFDYLRDEWRTASKDSNKIKTFGTRGEYKTDTAGIKDYKYHAYGVAYVHENEDIKLGRGTGWYTGIVHNTFKFKDIGNSKEEMLQAKVGLLKSVPFDDNNSLNWTISGDIFVGHNKMHRKYLVVNEVFHAKSKYYTYGIGVKNEIGKEFRLSEGFSLRPYAALNLEYGRTSKIKEKSGEVRLEVKHNDYFSVRPEVGAELAFKHYFGMKALKTSFGVAYENELGRVANAKNKARVGYTSAGWYDLRGEKEDRRGNVKFDFNVGVDNTRVGVTANVGYDTKGENLRGGLGLRVIF